MSDPTITLPVRPLGATGLPITSITLGGSPLGSAPEVFGRAVGTDQAVELVRQVLASPIRSIDTANGYGDGRSEERIGLGIAAAGGLPADYLIMTKVDARDGDYSGDRVRASVAESKARLGLATLPLVHLHDPEFFDFDDITRPGGAVDALLELRDAGEIGHVGLAGGDARVMQRYVDLGAFEVLLVHNRWTLVDHSAAGLLDQASRAGMGIVNAAIYGGGILATPRSGKSTYGYREASRETLRAVAAMADLCDEYGTELSTAALQASLRDRRVHSTIVGSSNPARIAGLVQASAVELPESFWARMAQLTPAAEHWLDAG